MKTSKLRELIRETIKEGNFDDRFKDQMGKAGFSDEEMDDVMSKSDQSWGFKEPGEDEDYRLEPEDIEDPDEDLVIIGSGYLDIKNNFGERPSQTNGEYAEIGQKVVDQLHNGDKDAALNYIYSRIN